MIKVYWTVTLKLVIRYCQMFDNFRTLFSWIRYTDMLYSSRKSVAVCFTIISNLAVTACVSVNNVRAVLFLGGIFLTEQRTQFTRRLENNFQFTELSTKLTKRVLSCSDLFPIKGRTQIILFSEASSTISFL